MVQKEQNNALDALKPGSGARQKLALELCHKSGLVVEYLEERNEMSETPLIREAADGRARNVLLLLEAGADVDARQENELAFTAMNQAAYFGNASCINHLLQFRADVNVTDGHGGTPLVAASLNGAVECVRLLLSNKADVNKPTNSGTTPLHKAAQRGHNKIIRMLIVEGADRDLKNGLKKTALELVDEHCDGALKEECKKSLQMTAHQIRAADWEEEKELDSGRKETHIRSFENQAHALRRELEEIIRVGDSEFCCEVDPGCRASGLKWINYGTTKPSHGRELSDPALSKALNAKNEAVILNSKNGADVANHIELTNQEFEEVKSQGIPDLYMDHFIILRDSYFKPAVKLFDICKSDPEEMGQLDVIDKVVREFEKVLAEHRSHDARWYNDGKPSQTCPQSFTPNSDRARSLTVRMKSDGKYRSAVSEMLRFTCAHSIVIYVQGCR